MQTTNHTHVALHSKIIMLLTFFLEKGTFWAISWYFIESMVRVLQN
jgi:hypothetical protein